nr:hypothetical protein [bacterium]
MNKKLILKLFLSIFAFVSLIIIVPIIFGNVISYICIGLARKAMFISKTLEFIKLESIVFVISLIISVILVASRRKEYKDGLFLINGLEYDLSTIVAIRYKRLFFLYKVKLMDNVDHKNTIYFNNKKEFDGFVNDPKMTNNPSVIDITNKRVTKLIFIAVTYVLALLVFIRGFDRFSYNKQEIIHSNYDSTYEENSNYLVTKDTIYHKSSNNKFKYYIKGSGNYSSYRVVDLELKEDSFNCIYIQQNYTTNMLVTENISYKGTDNKIVSVEEEKDDNYYYELYGLSHIRNQLFPINDYGNYFAGKSPTPEGEYKEDIDNIMNFIVSKSKSKTTNHKLRGNAKIVDNSIYFSIHHFRKNNDYRYITKSELYKYDLATKQI